MERLKTDETGNGILQTTVTANAANETMRSILLICKTLVSSWLCIYHSAGRDIIAWLIWLEVREI